MKKLFFSVLISIICVSLHAQSIIKVNVIDSISKEPISGATILLKNGDSIVSDNDGQFQLKLNGEQEIDITINAIGYFKKQILVPKQKNFTTTLNRTRTLMMPIEIKSVRAGENFPFTQSLISKKKLDGKNLGQDIPFLLNQVPGTVINSDAGNGIGYTGIRIRGTDATRINIT